MAGSNPREDVNAFLVRFKQTLSCVADSFVLPSGFHPAPILHSVTLVPPRGRAGDPVPLLGRRGRRGVWLSVGHEYRIVPREDEEDPLNRYNVSTAGYAYVILDEQGNEILAYHWHPQDLLQPGRRSKVRSPHLHLSNTVQPIPLGRDYAPVALADMHVRTGRMLLEDVVELLIEEFEVRPLASEWQEIIEENRSHVLHGRTP